MIDETTREALVGSDLYGTAKRWEIVSSEPLSPSDMRLCTRRVVTADGATLIQRTPRAGSDERDRLMLDNEIRALARLTRAFPPGRPQPFPTLVGYAIDGPEPWALHTDYRGVPAREVAAGLLGTGLTEFMVGVFDAIAHLSLVEVAHGRLTLDTVYLSGGQVQLVGFEDAALFGEPTRHGRRPAGPASDLTAAGHLLYEAFTGMPVRNGRPDLSEVPFLASRLPDLFGDPRARPPVVDVLSRLGQSNPPMLEQPDELEAGRAAFDDTRRRKLPSEQLTVRTRPVIPSPVAAGPRPSRSTTAVTVLCAAAALMVLVVLYLAMKGNPW